MGIRCRAASMRTMPRRPGLPSAGQLDPMPLPHIHLAAEYAPAVVDSRVRSGRWVRIRPGAYLPADPGLTDSAARRARGLGRIVALDRQLRLPYTLSHESAALLWGLPLVSNREVTHLIQTSKPRGHGPRDVVRHVHDLPAEHRTVHRGQPATTLERTVVDCAMSLPPLAGLILADAALHIGADRGSCLAILAEMVGRRGVRRAREILALADGGAESPGESKVRFIVLRAGLPVPQTQVEVRTHLGTFWTDLGWEEWQLVAEYDGVVKYGSTGTATEDILREKRREDAIVETGRRMIRTSSADTRHPDLLLRRIAKVLPPGTLDRREPRPHLTW